MDLETHSAKKHEVELVVFEVAGRTYGAAAADVGRISIRDAGAPLAPNLGMPVVMDRVLVVRSGERDVEVPINRLVGFRHVAPRTLRRVPPFVKDLSEPALVGFVVGEKEELLVLVDLQAMVRER